MKISRLPQTILSPSKPRRPFTRTALALGITALTSAPAWSLPEGGTVANGDGTFTHNGQTLTIDQLSQRLTLHWDSFNIGEDQTVTFQQPDADAIALNRVLGNNGSEILGNLEANGRVFLINPNGILFGDNAQVDVGGLVASTLSLSDEAFARSDFVFKGNATPGTVTNYGQIHADGGSVALLGGQVNNQGVIRAQRGSIALAAGERMTLDFAGDGLLNVQVDEGVADALVTNGNLLQADGGQVLMTARASEALLDTVVNNTGVVRAQTLEERGGKIFLLGGFDGGRLDVGGTLDASASDGGKGGFIDTSGAHVRIADDVMVSTRADHGGTGTWLIDPTDFTVYANTGDQVRSGIGAATLQNRLADNNVILQTVAGGSEAGNISVNARVTWDADTTLTLNAHNNININAPITVESADGGLALNYGAFAQIGTAASDTGYRVLAPVSFTAGSGGSFSVNGNAFTLIHNVNELQDINAADLGGRYALATDIDASGTAGWDSAAGFMPIGNSDDPFTGTFDGLGHAVHDLTINRSNISSVGLFGRTASAAIRHIGVKSANITGSDEVGALVGLQDGGSITHASADSIVVGGSEVGGLVGLQNSGSITAAYTAGTVTGSRALGGLVGKLAGGSITDSYATGSVSGGSFVGGLVGIQESSITRAYATGSVSGDFYLGGLVGAQGGSITDSYWNTETTGQNEIGNRQGMTTEAMFQSENFEGFDFSTVWGNGADQTTPYLLGMSDNPVFNRNDVPSGAVSTTNLPDVYTAILNLHQLQAINSGLAGRYAMVAEIDASDTVGWDNGAGFVPLGSGAKPFAGTFDGLGHAVHNLSIERSGTNYVGLIGHSDGAEIRNIGLENANIVGRSYTGGLIGRQIGGRITGAYVNGTVGGHNNVGALVGQKTAGAVIAKVHTRGAVSGSNSIGGIVGTQDSGTVTNVFSTAAVSGNENSAGLVGSQYNDSTITYAYATGAVSGAGNTGGLVSNQQGGSVANSYWNMETTGQETSIGGGQGLITEAMFRSATFEGFEFGTVWDNSTDRTTPYLLGLSGNPVFNRNDLPSGTLSAVNPPNVYTAILDVHQLQMISSELSGHYLLAMDIEAGETSGWNDGKGFEPIGNNFLNAFIGTFDGLDHVVHDLTIHREDTSSVGLFGYTDSAAIRDVGLESANISGRNDVGGLVGWKSGGSITNAYVTGSVNGERQVGGLVGRQNNASVADAYASATVSGFSAIGGLVGLQTNTSKLANAYATGSVAGEGDDIGGLVGAQESGSTLNSSYASGAVEGSIRVGGLVGYQDEGSITGSYATGMVRSIGTGSSFGGLVGRQDNSSISDAYATGTVNGAFISGGLVGTQDSSSITASYAIGSVSGINGIGGLVGSQLNNSSIVKAYATGEVSGELALGGLVGGQNNSTITTAYATGAVSGIDDVGGLVGRLIGTSSTSNSYWNTDANPILEGVADGNQDGVFGRTRDELRQQDTFAGWDIDNQGGTGSVWRIYEGDTTPRLRSFLTTLEVTVQDNTTVYDGSHQTGAGDYLIAGSYDKELLLGTAVNTEGGRDVGTYNLGLTGLYSEHQGYDLVVQDATLTVKPRVITIAADDRRKTYGSTDPTLTWSVAEGSLISGDDLGINLSRDAGENAGGYTINHGKPSNVNYDITLIDGLFTVDPRAITVSIDNASKIYGNDDVELTWQVTDGALAYEDSLTGDLSRATGEDAGEYDILGKLSGDLSSDNYDVALDAGLFTISPRAITVGIDDSSKIYGNDDADFTWQITDGALAYEDSLTGDLSRTSGEDAGSYDIFGKLSGDLSTGNYDVALESGLFTITPRAITLGIDDASKVYGDDDADFTWRVTSGDFAFDDELTGDLARIDGEAVASYDISAKLSGALSSSNYEVVMNNGHLTITPRPITVGIDDARKVYGNDDPEFTLQVTGGELAFQDVLAGNLSHDGVNAGNHAITGNVIGDLASDNYDVILSSGQLTISPRAISVAVDDAVKVYGDNDPDFNWQLTDGSLAYDDTFDGDIERPAGENVGAYSLSGALIGDLGSGNYDVTQHTGTLTITPRQLSVSADDVATWWDLLPSTFGVSVEGLVLGDTAESVLGGEQQVATNLVDPTPGVYTLIPEGFELNSANHTSNYTLELNDGTVTLFDSRAGQTYETTVGTGESFTQQQTDDPSRIAPPTPSLVFSSRHQLPNLYWVNQGINAQTDAMTDLPGE